MQVVQEFMAAAQGFLWWQPLAAFGGGFAVALLLFARMPMPLVAFFLGVLGFASGLGSYVFYVWPGAIWAGSAVLGVSVGAAATKIMHSYAIERQRREVVDGAALKGAR